MLFRFDTKLFKEEQSAVELAKQIEPAKLSSNKQLVQYGESGQQCRRVAFIWKFVERGWTQQLQCVRGVVVLFHIVVVLIVNVVQPRVSGGERHWFAWIGSDIAAAERDITQSAGQLSTWVEKSYHSDHTKETGVVQHIGGVEQAGVVPEGAIECRIFGRRRCDKRCQFNVQKRCQTCRPGHSQQFVQ